MNAVTSGMAKKEPEYILAEKEIEIEIDGLKGDIDVLVDRLTYVLRPTLEPDPEASLPAPAASPATAKIRDFTHRIVQARAAVRDLMERLDI